MKIKKTGILTAAVFLAVMVQSVVPAGAAQAGTALTVQVPESHNIALNAQEHSFVSVEGTVYTGSQEIQVERLKEQIYTVGAEDGWEVDTVTYGPEGEEEEVFLSEGVFTAPALNRDGNVLTITVTKAKDVPAETEESETEAPQTEEPETETAQTGSFAAGTGGSGSQTGGSSGSVKTGDESSPLLWTGILLLGLGGIAIMGQRLGRSRKL